MTKDTTKTAGVRIANAIIAASDCDMSENERGSTT